MSPTREQQAVRAGRPLGSTALVPSALAFGGAPLGGLYETVSDDEAERAVKRALELGLRYLDTAPHYGLGVSEWRMGERCAASRVIPASSRSRSGDCYAAAAVQFPLGHPAVVSVRVGARSQREVEQKAGAFNTAGDPGANRRPPPSLGCQAAPLCVPRPARV